MAQKTSTIMAMTVRIREFEVSTFKGLVGLSRQPSKRRKIQGRAGSLQNVRQVQHFRYPRFCIATRLHWHQTRWELQALQVLPPSCPRVIQIQVNPVDCGGCILPLGLAGGCSLYTQHTFVS